MRPPPGQPPNSCTAWADATIYDQLEAAPGKQAKRVVVRRPRLVPVYTRCAYHTTAPYGQRPMARAGCIGLDAPTTSPDI